MKNVLNVEDCELMYDNWIATEKVYKDWKKKETKIVARLIEEKQLWSKYTTFDDIVNHCIDVTKKNDILLTLDGAYYDEIKFDDIQLLLKKNWWKSELFDYCSAFLNGMNSKYHITNLNFYTTLVERINKNTLLAEDKHNWIMRSHYVDYSKIAIPIIKDGHFFGLSIDLEKNVIKYFDGLYKDKSKRYLNDVQIWLESLEETHLFKKKDKKAYAIDMIQIEQKDGYNCGPLLFRFFMDEFSNKKIKLGSSKEEMEYFRKQLFLNVVTGTFVVERVIR